MTAELEEFVARNSGFQQFCDRYQFVAADPETRNEFLKWRRELMRQQGMLDAAFEEGEAQERAKWESKVAELKAESARERAKWESEIAELKAELAKRTNQ
jgi:hypothetical protein